nr:hypothetical protein [Sedimentibacter sp.]
MQYITIIVLASLITIIILIISHIRSENRIKSWLAEYFGKIPKQKKCEFESIESYHNHKKAHPGSSELIDGITWDDLDMNAVFKRINTCLTSVGEEYMYDALHQVQTGEEALLKRESLINCLEENPDIMLKLQMNLAKSGKYNYSGLASFIFDPSSKVLKYPFIYNILALIPVICICMAFFTQTGVLLFILAGILNGFVYYRTKSKIERELSAIRHFSSVLHCINKICKIKGFEEFPFFAELNKSFNIFKSLRTSLSGILQKDFSDIAIFAEYVKIIFLIDIRSYSKSIQRILKYTDDFHTMYKCLGEIDMAICVLSFRKSLPFYCRPVFHGENSIYFEELYHPLLSVPVPNSGKINRNSIVTGSNASGKSTFIKALAVNGILAQTIHTCGAKNFNLRPSLIITSMAVRDSISEGDSYFIKEIKSLKRILDKVQSTACTCFVDEILKGTNTIERIAASAAVLKYLSNTDCLCVTASHDIELTHILSSEYDNYHFREYIADDGIHFDYKLKEGPSQTRNAIKLLHYMNFDSQIVEDAESMVNKFVDSKTW